MQSYKDAQIAKSKTSLEGGWWVAGPLFHQKTC